MVPTQSVKTTKFSHLKTNHRSHTMHAHIYYFHNYKAYENYSVLYTLYCANLMEAYIFFSSNLI